MSSLSVDTTHNDMCEISANANKFFTVNVKINESGQHLYFRTSKLSARANTNT